MALCQVLCKAQNPRFPYKNPQVCYNKAILKDCLSPSPKINRGFWKKFSLDKIKIDVS